jgi:hypothetical protein
MPGAGPELVQPAGKEEELNISPKMIALNPEDINEIKQMKNKTVFIIISL